MDLSLFKILLNLLLCFYYIELKLQEFHFKSAILLVSFSALEN
jgi:hypothetical protein